MTELHPHHNPPPDNIYDVTFIGAGPSALFGAFYAGMREMSCKLIDTQDQVGGQLTALYPEKWIYDAPGYPKILAKDLIKRLLEQAAHWNPKICLSEQVEMIRKDQDIIFLESAKGEHKTRTLIISAGQGTMQVRELENEAINRYKNKGLFYSVKEKNRFLGKRLLIVGGGDSAFDWALGLKDYAKEVTLIHRSEKYKAESATIAIVQHTSSIKLKPFFELKRIEGENKVEKATIFDNRTKEETDLEVDNVLLLLGFVPEPGPMKDWDLEFIKEYSKDGKPLLKHIRVNSRQETNIPGVYAIGDIAENPEVEPMGLIASGYGQAPVAVSYADVYIHPGKSVKPGHSSNLKL